MFKVTFAYSALQTPQVHPGLEVLKPWVNERLITHESQTRELAWTSTGKANLTLKQNKYWNLQCKCITDHTILTIFFSWNGFKVFSFCLSFSLSLWNTGPDVPLDGNGYCLKYQFWFFFFSFLLGEHLLLHVFLNTIYRLLCKNAYTRMTVTAGYWIASNAIKDQNEESFSHGSPAAQLGGSLRRNWKKNEGGQQRGW